MKKEHRVTASVMWKDRGERGGKKGMAGKWGLSGQLGSGHESEDGRGGTVEKGQTGWGWGKWWSSWGS